MHKVSILWGWSHENGDKAVTYKFKTQGELDAFWLGVQDMDGHLGWEVVEENGIQFCTVRTQILKLRSTRKRSHDESLLVVDHCNEAFTRLGADSRSSRRICRYLL